MSAPAPLLAVRDLAVRFPGRGRVVDGVSFDLEAGRTLALVGESGSGKSITALALLGLSGGEVEGSALFGGKDLLRLCAREARRVRGAEVAMVFQEPGSALDPVFSAGEQIAEVLSAHGDPLRTAVSDPGHAGARRRLARGEARRRAVELLAAVGLPDPERAARAYPHELSGGMRQRVLIAMATACAPRVLLADEPTTALDVTVQAGILELLRGLQRASGTAILLISHDLGVVAGSAERVCVMHAGRIVEDAPAEDLFARPRHPYTLELLRARAALAAAGPLRPPARTSSLRAAARAEPGCRYRARCPLAREECARADPALLPAGPTRRAACFFAAEVPLP